MSAYAVLLSRPLLAGFVALADLPEEPREVFLLRAQGDLELAEIAELTQIPVETVKSRLRYALQKLRRLLADPAAEELSV
jgi:DNA-directed RNA polymerase specialized sigma24 family protein